MPIFISSSSQTVGHSKSRVLQLSKTYGRLPLPHYRLTNGFNSMVREAHELGSLIAGIYSMSPGSLKAQTWGPGPGGGGGGGRGGGENGANA